MKTRINSLKNIIMIILGLLIIIYYFWFRFVRERLPQDIPFTLSILSFLSLNILCTIYIYSFYKLCKKKKTPSFLQQYIFIVFSFMVKPLIIFDNYLKSFTIINQGFSNLGLLFASVILKYKLYSSEMFITKLLYITFNYIPNIILLISFII